MSEAIEGYRRRWGDRGEEAEPKAMHLLKRQGYVLTDRWEWRTPKPSHVVSAEEADAIQFLIDEWDLGGLEQ
jgi:hypothetical protein